jgi:hypothetical protein
MPIKAKIVPKLSFAGCSKSMKFRSISGFSSLIFFKMLYYTSLDSFFITFGLFLIIINYSSSLLTKVLIVLASKTSIFFSRNSSKDFDKMLVTWLKDLKNSDFLSFTNDNRAYKRQLKPLYKSCSYNILHPSLVFSRNVSKSGSLSSKE